MKIMEAQEKKHELAKEIERLIFEFEQDTGLAVSSIKRVVNKGLVRISDYVSYIDIYVEL